MWMSPIFLLKGKLFEEKLEQGEHEDTADFLDRITENHISSGSLVNDLITVTKTLAARALLFFSL